MITIPGKIPVSIHPLFWLVAFFIGWIWTSSLAGALVCLLVILFSVLVHEFGHALAANIFKQKARIELAAFGGFTYREGDKLKLWKEFIVVLCGPLAGCMLFVAAYGIYLFAAPVTNPLLAFAIRFTFVANLFWTAINLLPVLPLDGGHLLSIILEGLFGFKGVKWAIVIGLTLSIIISTFCFALGMFLLGALFLLMTFESFRSLRYYKIFSEQDREPKLQTLLRQADEDLLNGNMPEAIDKLQEVIDTAKTGILFTMASAKLAEVYHEAHQDDQAYALLRPIKKHLNGSQLALFHLLAFHHSDYESVTIIASQCYQESPSYKTALINALSYACLSQSEPAVGWLECAIREGLPSLPEAIKRKEFDSIRDDQQFKQFELKYPY